MTIEAPTRVGHAPVRSSKVQVARRHVGDEPRLAAGAVDLARRLENFGGACADKGRKIQDAAVLRSLRRPVVVVARVDRPEMPEVVPIDRVITATLVDMPEFRPERYGGEILGAQARLKNIRGRR